MTDQDHETFKRHLQSWQPDLERDPQLASHVLNRIASSSQPNRLLGRSVKPLWIWSAVGLAAAIVLIFVLNPVPLDRGLTYDSDYLSMIDPVSRLGSGSQHEGNETVVDQLAWMKDRLDLSRDQFMELVALHEDYASRFDQLYSQLVQMEQRYSAFEELRLKNEMIDFIALFELLEERQEKVDHSHALTEEFLVQAGSLLNPNQRRAYLSLISPTLAAGDV